MLKPFLWMSVLGVVSKVTHNPDDRGILYPFLLFINWVSAAGWVISLLWFVYEFGKWALPIMFS